VRPKVQIIDLWSVAILELKTWGATAGPRRKQGATYCKCPSWWFSVIL